MGVKTYIALRHTRTNGYFFQTDDLDLVPHSDSSSDQVGKPLLNSINSSGGGKSESGSTGSNSVRKDDSDHESVPSLGEDAMLTPSTPSAADKTDLDSLDVGAIGNTGQGQSDDVGLVNIENVPPIDDPSPDVSAGREDANPEILQHATHRDGTSREEFEPLSGGCSVASKGDDTNPENPDCVPPVEEFTPEVYNSSSVDGGAVREYTYLEYPFAPIDEPSCKETDPFLGEAQVGVDDTDPDNPGNLPPIYEPQREEPDMTLGEGAVGGKTDDTGPENPENVLPIHEPSHEESDSFLGEWAIGGTGNYTGHEIPGNIPTIDEPPPEEPNITLGKETVVGQGDNTHPENTANVFPRFEPAPNREISDPPQPLGTLLHDPVAMPLDDTLSGLDVDDLFNCPATGRYF